MWFEARSWGYCQDKVRRNSIRREHIEITKKLEYKSMLNDTLKQILKDEYQIAGISGKNKEWLVAKLLQVRGEPDSDQPVTKIVRWSEFAAQVSKLNGLCKVIYIGRHYLALYPNASLDVFMPKF